MAVAINEFTIERAVNIAVRPSGKSANIVATPSQENDEGLPGIAVLCVERVAKIGQLVGIDTFDQLYGSILSDLKNGLGSNWARIEPLIARMALERGISIPEIESDTKAIQNSITAGHLVADDGYVCIKPDGLNDYIANQIFFPDGAAGVITDLALAKAACTRPKETLRTLINLGKRDAAASLLETFAQHSEKKTSGPDLRTTVELGVMACEGFKMRDASFVEKALHNYHDHLETLQDPDLSSRVASVLAAEGRIQEAHNCWIQSAKLYQATKNDWGVAQAQAAAADMYLRFSRWKRAHEFYDLALKTLAKVTGDSSQWGEGRLRNLLGLLYSSQGHWEKALQEHTRARSIFERLPDKSGIQGVGETDMMLGSYCHRQKDLLRAHSCYESAIRNLEEARDWSGISRAYSQLSLLYADEGDWRAAREAHGNAQHLLVDLGDSRTSAEVSKAFGNLYLQKSDYAQATVFYAEAREILRCLGDAAGAAEVEMSLGYVYERQGNRDEAVAQFQGSADFFMQHDDVRNHANCELGLGIVFHGRGDRDAARAHYEIAEREFSQVEDERGKAFVLVNLGLLSRDEGQPGIAAAKYEQALEIFKRNKEMQGIASTLLHLGALRQADGRTDDALSCYREALDITNQIGAVRETLEAYSSIASAYLAQGLRERALQLYRDALKGFESLGRGSRTEKARIELRISGILQAEGDMESAMALCKSALDTAKQLENADLISEANSAIAWLYERDAKWVNAALLFEEALATFKRIGAPLAAAEAARSLGWIHYRWGNLEQARTYCVEAEAILEPSRDRASLARVHVLHALLSVEDRDFERAFALFKSVEETWNQLNARASLMILYNNEALARQKAGQLEQAIELCGRSLALADKLKERRIQSYSETILGMCYRDLKSWHDAEWHFQRGIEIKQAEIDSYGLAYSDAEVGIMHRERSRLDDAEVGLIRALESFLLLDCKLDARHVVQEIYKLANEFRLLGENDRAKRLEGVAVS